MTSHATYAEAKLEPRLVGDINGEFVVPGYQRGYRWGVHEVGQLLSDLYENAGATYYLQPLVTKPLGDNRWELVDGQQRLTTLYLIFAYMKQQGLQSEGASFSMEYATREGSTKYLATLDEASSTDNIDYFHMFQAHSCISQWLDGHGARRQYVANKIYGAFFETVRVIWYEAPSELDSTTLFTRLNVGRIPLTDAELVKALILSRSHGGDGTADQAHQIAAQWDGIERELQAPEMWAFITAGNRDSATRISLLLDSLVPVPNGEERPVFYTFEALRKRIEAPTDGVASTGAVDAVRAAARDVWDAVVDRHSLLVGWYEDRDLFHKIGFLTATGTSFEDLIGLTDQLTRPEFEALLDDSIRRQLNLTQTAVGDLNYETTPAKCEEVLLLMNAESIRSHRHSSERYSFMEHARGSWSLEHIHAQNAAQLTTADQWIAWLRLHRRTLVVVPTASESTRDALIERIDKALPEVTGPLFRSIEQDVVAYLSANDDSVGDATHSIANLALLDRESNSALSNAVFAAKRLELLKRDLEGRYIPVCTRNVFLKYYTGAESQQIHFWGAQDRLDYLNAIRDTIGRYLTEDDAT